MKIIYVTATAMLIAACATHPGRCRGPLQPINKPVAAASGSKAAPAEARP